jgi:hypothetical protein
MASSLGIDEGTGLADTVTVYDAGVFEGQPFSARLEKAQRETPR